MVKLFKKAKQAVVEQDGAALLEYTVLLGIILAGTIVLITAAGDWVVAQWTILSTALGFST